MGAADRPRHGVTATRRRFLQGGAGAVTLTVGSAVWPPARPARPAFAQEAGDTATTRFLESVELALVEGYGRIDPSLLAPDLAASVTAFTDHHRAHSAALAELASDAARGQPNPRLLDDIEARLDRADDERSVLEVVYSLETAVAATHLFALGVLEASRALELAASILPVESEHAVVFGTALERPLNEIAPTFVNHDAAFKPDAFPIGS